MIEVAIVSMQDALLRQLRDKLAQATDVSRRTTGMYRKGRSF